MSEQVSTELCKLLPILHITGSCIQNPFTAPSFHKNESALYPDKQSSTSAKTTSCLVQVCGNSLVVQILLREDALPVIQDVQETCLNQDEMKPHLSLLRWVTGRMPKLHSKKVPQAKFRTAIEIQCKHQTDWFSEPIQFYHSIGAQIWVSATHCLKWGWMLGWTYK